MMRLASLMIGIAGLGGLGTRVAWSLARLFPAKLIIADFDIGRTFKYESAGVFSRADRNDKGFCHTRKYTENKSVCFGRDAIQFD